MTIFEFFVVIPVLILLMLSPFVLIAFLVEVVCWLWRKPTMCRWYTADHIRAKANQFIIILNKRFKKEESKGSGWKIRAYYLDGSIGLLEYLSFFDKGRNTYSAIDIDFDLGWATDMHSSLRKEFMRFLKRKNT